MHVNRHIGVIIIIYGNFFITWVCDIFEKTGLILFIFGPVVNRKIDLGSVPKCNILAHYFINFVCSDISKDESVDVVDIGYSDQPP